MFIIYQITNKLNGKSYVGFTSKSKEYRWLEHQRKALKGAKTHLHRALRKYGAGVFTLETLEEGWNTEIGKNVREPYWISVLKPEYNMTPGGDGTGAGNESAKFGTTLTLYTKEKIRKARIGFRASKETKMKMRASHIGVKARENHPLWGLKGELSPNFGSKRTPEQKARMRRANNSPKKEM